MLLQTLWAHQRPGPSTVVKNGQLAWQVAISAPKIIEHDNTVPLIQLAVGQKAGTRCRHVAYKVSFLVGDGKQEIPAAGHSDYRKREADWEPVTPVSIKLESKRGVFSVL